MDDQQRPRHDGIPPVPVPGNASDTTSMPTAATVGWDELFAPADIVDSLDRLLEDAIPRLERLAGIDIPRLQPLPSLSRWIDETAERHGLDDRKVRILRIMARATHPYTRIAVVPLRLLAAQTAASVRVVSRDLQQLRISSLVWRHRRRGAATAYELLAGEDAFPERPATPSALAYGLLLLDNLYTMRRYLVLQPDPVDADDARRSLHKSSHAARERFRREYLADFFGHS